MTPQMDAIYHRTHLGDALLHALQALCVAGELEEAEARRILADFNEVKGETAVMSSHPDGNNPASTSDSISSRRMGNKAPARHSAQSSQDQLTADCIKANGDLVLPHSVSHGADNDTYSCAWPLWPPFQDVLILISRRKHGTETNPDKPALRRRGAALRDTHRNVFPMRMSYKRGNTPAC